MIGWDWRCCLPLSGAHKMGMLGISAVEKQKRKRDFWLPGSIEKQVSVGMVMCLEHNKNWI